MSHKIISTSFKTYINFQKVQRVIKFKQCKWLEQYISLNTKYRINAKMSQRKKYVNF